MKIVFLSLFLTIASVWGAPEDAPITPLKAIEKDGSLSISDGSSFFTFSKDGSFQSGPLGMSGRTFEGRWTAHERTFTVEAKLEWINGPSLSREYRRIVFVIYDLRKRSSETKPTFGPAVLYDSYFLIEELVSIPKPLDFNPH